LIQWLGDIKFEYCMAWAILQAPPQALLMESGHPLLATRSAYIKMAVSIKGHSHFYVVSTAKAVSSYYPYRIDYF